MGTSRRALLAAASVAGLWSQLGHESAEATGGATAGKYSTIPAAKRRFFGRVREGVYEWKLMEPAVERGDLQDPTIVSFFSKSVILQRAGEPKGGNCNPDWDKNKCLTKEKRTSRWNDYKEAQLLLASGFIFSSMDIAERTPGYRIAQSYQKKMEKFKLAVQQGEVAEAQAQYKLAKGDLRRYLPYMELEPLEHPDYTHEWDTRPEVLCSGKTCY